MKHAAYVVVGFAIIITSGCASIVSGHNQSVSVETRHSGQSITGANCTLTNNKGTWFVTSPGSVTVHRSFQDMTVNCEKAGDQPGALTVKSSTKGMAFGNILFGGVIGAGVDIGTGAAYDYPPLITVEMGQSIIPAAGTNTTDKTGDTTALPIAISNKQSALKP
jgi:hypothetical protein